MVSVNTFVGMPSPITLMPGNLNNNVDREESTTVGTNTSTQKRNNVVMKSNTEDIDKISSLLSHELLRKMDMIHDDGVLNWKARMEGLRIKADLQKQLQLRLNAVSIGMQMMSKCDQLVCVGEDQFEQNSSSEYDKMRLLWSHDPFRNMLEIASKASRESNLWHNHNFALVPESIHYLQHTMLTVKEEISQDVTGFCEIAMLEIPPYFLFCENDVCELSSDSRIYIPTIVNVIVSPSHRRQGIASRLIKSAIRYVRNNWKDLSGAKVSSMGLYVDDQNSAAKSIYEKEGFVIVGRSEKNKNLLFMQLSFREDSFE